MRVSNPRELASTYNSYEHEYALERTRTSIADFRRDRIHLLLHGRRLQERYYVQYIDTIYNHLDR